MAVSNDYLSSKRCFGHEYDEHFIKARDAYLPRIDWRLLKAQACQESQLIPDAVSPVGASGISQFMPGTWREVSAQLGLGGDPNNIKDATMAQAYYMSRLMKKWRTNRPIIEKWNLALASYNAGFGNIHCAQKRQKNKRMAHLYWSSILLSLEDCTGHYSNETITYVDRSKSIYIEIVSS